NNNLFSLNEELNKNKVKEKVKEVIKEVDKTDYQTIEKLKRQIEQMKRNNEDLTSKEKEIKLLELDANKSVLKTKISIDNFLKEVSFNSYRRGAIAASSNATKTRLSEGL